MSLRPQRKVEVLKCPCCLGRERGMDVLTGVADVLPQQAGWDGVYGFSCRNLEICTCNHKIQRVISQILISEPVWSFFFFCLFTCKRSDSGMSDCSSRTEVSIWLFALVAAAPLALPARPLPALLAMMCSDRWRSSDSSGTSRRRKTTSKRERRAEPILRDGNTRL